MKEPHHKYYEIPLEDGISEEEAQEEYQQGMELIKELIRDYRGTKANDSERFNMKIICDHCKFGTDDKKCYQGGMEKCQGELFQAKPNANFIECSVKEARYKDFKRTNPVVNLNNVNSIKKSKQKMYYGAEIPQIVFNGEIYWEYDPGDFKRRDAEYDAILGKKEE